MTHLSPEQLAELALSPDTGPGPAADSTALSHLAGCASCRAEFESLRSLTQQAREDGFPRTLQAPPASTWTAIRAQISDAAPVTSNGTSSPTPRPSTAPVSTRGVRWKVAVAAAVGLLVGAAGGVGLSSLGGPAAAPGPGRPTTATPSATPPTQVVARAQLNPLGGGSDGGTATVVRTPAGTVLNLNVSLRPSPGHYYELWLANTDLTRMYALGMVAPTGGTRYSLPASQSQLVGYTTLDISLQAYDGNPAHSHRSLARGVLR